MLATLRRSGDPFQLTPTELTRTVLLTSGAMTAALGRLEKKRLVCRTRDDLDGRIRLVALTPAGIALIDRAIAVRFADANGLVASLSGDNLEQLATLLRSLLVSLAGSE